MAQHHEDALYDVESSDVVDLWKEAGLAARTPHPAVLEGAEHDVPDGSLGGILFQQLHREVQQMLVIHVLRFHASIVTGDDTQPGHLAILLVMTLGVEDSVQLERFVVSHGVFT